MPSDTTSSTGGDDSNNTSINFLGQAASIAFGFLAAKQQRDSVKDQIKSKEDAIRRGVSILEECCDAFPEHGEPVDVFGRKPDVAEYTKVGYEPVYYEPIDVCEEAECAAQCNIDSCDTYEELTAKTNEFNIGQGLKRVEEIVPDYDCASTKNGENICKLNKGVLPEQDVMKIMSRTAELQGFLGTPGCTFPLNLFDLGVSQLNAQSVGHQRFLATTQLADQTISSQTRQMDIRENYVRPADKVNTQINQNNSVYQAELTATKDSYLNDVRNEQGVRLSDQRVNDVAAAYDPALKGMSLQAFQCCQLQAQMEASLAGINYPVTPASETGFGFLSNFFGSDQGTQLLSNTGNFASGFFNNPFSNPLSPNNTQQPANPYQPSYGDSAKSGLVT